MRTVCVSRRPLLRRSSSPWRVEDFRYYDPAFFEALRANLADHDAAIAALRRT